MAIANANRYKIHIGEHHCYIQCLKFRSFKSMRITGFRVGWNSTSCIHSYLYDQKYYFLRDSEIYLYCLFQKNLETQSKLFIRQIYWINQLTECEYFVCSSHDYKLIYSRNWFESFSKLISENNKIINPFIYSTISRNRSTVNWKKNRIFPIQLSPSYHLFLGKKSSKVPSFFFLFLQKGTPFVVYCQKIQ